MNSWRRQVDMQFVLPPRFLASSKIFTHAYISQVDVARFQNRIELSESFASGTCLSAERNHITSSGLMVAPCERSTTWRGRAWHSVSRKQAGRGHHTRCCCEPELTRQPNMSHYSKFEVARTMTGQCDSNGQIEFRVKY